MYTILLQNDSKPPVSLSFFVLLLIVSNDWPPDYANYHGQFRVTVSLSCLEYLTTRNRQLQSHAIDCRCNGPAKQTFHDTFTQRGVSVAQENAVNHDKGEIHMVCVTCLSKAAMTPCSPERFLSFLVLLLYFCDSIVVPVCPQKTGVQTSGRAPRGRRYMRPCGEKKYYLLCGQRALWTGGQAGRAVK